jgi:integrase
MGLIIECPQCKTRNSPKADKCKCGVALKKHGHKNYWIEYYDEYGQRRRERIGPSKAAAEQRLREVLNARTEGRHIQKDWAAKVTLGELCSWYMSLTEVRAKASYDRDEDSIENLKRLLGENTKIRDLSVGKVESYQRKRLDERSPVHPSSKIRPATVNRELSCLKTIMNRAVRHGKLRENPISDAKKLQENNVRERILTPDEFGRLLNASDDHLKPVILVAYFSGMRKSEILGLTWDEVDLEKGFIRLHAQRTKTRVGRSIPLHPKVKEALTTLQREVSSERVFLHRGKPLLDVKKSYRSACKRAGIEDFTFHDLRHCAINALRVAGNDYFKIMTVSGHRTMSVFKRYNLVTEEELRNLNWPDN